MVTFREYLLEYVKDKDKSLFFGISKMKHGNNGKDWNNPHGRKHMNTVPIEYNHKHPIINSICQGRADNIQVTGANLNTIGNSDVEIEMFEDEESRQFGKLRNKKKVQPNGM